MNSIFKSLMNPPVDGPAATLWLRLMCGGVFFWEGILKFVYANQGVGRFTKLGLPFPGPTADFVAVLEIVGGLMLLAGLGTRLIAIPFVIEMIVAVLMTKITLFLGTSPLPPPPAPPLSRILGCPPRSPLRVRSTADCAILVYCRTWTLVARRPAGSPPGRCSPGQSPDLYIRPWRFSRSVDALLNRDQRFVRRRIHGRRTQRRSDCRAIGSRQPRKCCVAAGPLRAARARAGDFGTGSRSGGRDRSRCVRGRVARREQL